jgi:outer membrane protein
VDDPAARTERISLVPYLPMSFRLALNKPMAAVLIGLLAIGQVCAQERSNPAALSTSAEPLSPSLPIETAPVPWWDESVRQPLLNENTPLSIDLDSAVMGVLMFSPQVRIAADFPVIRSTQIANAASQFDPRAFFDSKFTDTSDPVGNLLTTGGAKRFIDQTAISSGGIRKSFTSGGQLEAAQRVGYQNNNSNFFIPKDQGTSRITLNYTQPLMRGRGNLYNTSLICLAELDTKAASAQLQSDLQDIILDTHRTYWELYLRRAALLQRIRLRQQAVDIQKELQARADFDVLQSQIVRANAAVATRDAAVIRFSTEIANSETKLRALINDPNLAAAHNELLPSIPPYRELVEPNLVDALTTALKNRPEIQVAFTQVRAASVRTGVSKNELMPQLDLLMGGYVTGLQGNSAIGQAWVDQFSLGRPTYWTGLQYEYPLYNRGPRAQMTQRMVELRQATSRLQQTMIDTRAETETAAREVVTTYREMVSKYQAMKADQAEIDYLTSRWRLLAGDQQLAGVVLNDLLDAHERLAEAEYDFAAAEAAYNIALVKLNVVMGILLQTQRVEMIDSSENGVPSIDIHSQPQPLNNMPMPTLDPPIWSEPTGPSAVTVRRDVEQVQSSTLPSPVLPQPDPTVGTGVPQFGPRR